MYFLGFTEMMGVTKTQNPHCQKQPVNQIKPNHAKSKPNKSNPINQSINQSISRINNDYW